MHDMGRAVALDFPHLLRPYHPIPTPRPLCLQNLGVKMSGGELIFPGQIIVRQRGTKFHGGGGVGMGRDHTLFSTSVGFVRFSDQVVTFDDGRRKERKVVSVEPINGDKSQVCGKCGRCGSP